MESRARGGGSSRAPPREVKVKHIITRKVSADEDSFKDVVQRFTGKDSAAARAELLRACDASPLEVARTTAPVVVAAAGASGADNGGVEGGGGGGSGFSTGAALSFQDTVLPPMEEMDRWLGSHGIDSYADRPRDG